MYYVSSSAYPIFNYAGVEFCSLTGCSWIPYTSILDEVTATAQLLLIWYLLVRLNTIYCAIMNNLFWQLIDRFRVELDTEMKPPVNWTNAAFFMESTIDFSALFVKTNVPGMFQVVPTIVFECTYIQAYTNTVRDVVFFGTVQAKSASIVESLPKAILKRYRSTARSMKRISNRRNSLDPTQIYTARPRGWDMVTASSCGAPSFKSSLRTSGVRADQRCRVRIANKYESETRLIIVIIVHSIIIICSLMVPLHFDEIRCRLWSGSQKPRCGWRCLGKAYAQQWAAIGWYITKRWIHILQNFTTTFPVLHPGSRYCPSQG